MEEEYPMEDGNNTPLKVSAHAHVPPLSEEKMEKVLEAGGPLQRADAYIRELEAKMGMCMKGIRERLHKMQEVTVEGIAIEHLSQDPLGGRAARATRRRGRSRSRSPSPSMDVEYR